MFNLNKLTVALLTSAAVTACGGGSSSQEPGDVTEYSLEVHVNGQLNQTSAKALQSAGSSVYTVCLDTDLDNSCAGEATERQTDAGGFALIEWNTGTVSRETAQGGIVLAYPTDGSTDEVLKYQLNRQKTKSENNGKVVYTPLELNAVSNIQRILGQSDFADTIGAPENTDFAALDPNGSAVLKVLLNSFSGLGFGSKDTDNLDRVLLRTLIRNAYKVLAEAVNQSGDYDAIVEKVLENYRADDTSSPFHDLIPEPAPGPYPAAGFDYVTDKCSVTFTNKSTAAEGKTLSYVWKFGDGQTSTEKNPVHDYMKSGTYGVTLVVTDSVLKNEASRNVAVSCEDNPQPGNHPPVAEFIVSTDGLKVSFINASSDPDGDVLSYLWDFGDGTTSQEQDPVHTYESVSTFTVKLTVKDKEYEDVKIMSIFITGPLPPEPNNPPVAKFTFNDLSGGLVEFKNESTDPDAGDVLSYRWNFGDGAESVELSPRHQYAVSGDYRVSLTACDGKECSDAVTESIHVSVSPEPGPFPSVDFSYEIKDNGTVQFTVKSDDGDDGISYMWNFGDGASSTEKNPSHTYTEFGTYTVVLTVSDGTKSGSKSVSITIKDPDDVKLDCTL